MKITTLSIKVQKRMSVRKILPPLLLATVFLVSCARIVFIKLYNNSNITLIAMTLFIVSVLIYQHNISKVTLNEYLFLLIPLLSIICLGISSFSLNVDTIMNYSKFLLSIMVACLCLRMDKGQIICFFHIFIFSVFLFTLYALFNKGTIFQHMLYTEGLNYLSITLLIAANTIIIFCKWLSSKKNIYIIMLLISFYTLLQYPARGALLFLILTIVATLIIYYKLSLINIIKLVFLILIGAAFIELFLELFADEYLLARLQKLFQNTKDERRIDIYVSYIDYITQNWRWVLGIGFSQSREILGYYPHNFILELFGEFGMIGFFMSLSILISYLKEIYIIKKNLKHNYSNSIFIGLSSCGFAIYFILTFMKSFSFYDGYQLFIAFAIFLVSNRIILEERGQ